MKLNPPAPPDPNLSASWESAAPVRRTKRPGRPANWRVLKRSQRSPNNLADPQVRARLVHTFMHHELQAAELFAWAILAFPDTPEEFRAGLMRLCLEELDHMQMYIQHIASLDACPGDFPVRDWFWERVASCENELAFVALQGLGLEGANLDHCKRFAERFRSVGDEAGASIIEQIGRDEIAHVAFGLKWFEYFSNDSLDYDRWSAALPAPLTPALMRGPRLHWGARTEAGMGPTFLKRLTHAGPTTQPAPARDPA